MIKILYTLLGKIFLTKMVNNFKPELWGRASKRDSKKKADQKRGNDERSLMDARSQEKISFGTMTFRRPQPTSKIKEFTLALPKSIRRCDLYEALAEALGDSWGMVKSTHIFLPDPLEWQETRRRIREALEPFIIEPKKED